MFSFFGDDDKPNNGKRPGGPIITKVRKTVTTTSSPKPRPSTSIGGISTTYKPPPSFSASSSKLPGPSRNGAASSSSLKAPTKPALSRPGSSSSFKSAQRSSPAPASTPKKRKIETKIESESDDSDSSDDPVQTKVRRSAPSRSTTIGLSGEAESKESERRCGSWCLDEVDKRGEWGRGWVGFVSCEEALRGEVSGWAGGERPAKGLEKYVPCELRRYD